MARDDIKASMKDIRHLSIEEQYNLLDDLGQLSTVASAYPKVGCVIVDDVYLMEMSTYRSWENRQVATWRQEHPISELHQEIIGRSL